MDSATPRSGPELIAELNDLLALDHDAIEAYSLAIGRVSRAEYREALAGFRGDHQRHVEQLTELIRARDGDSTIPLAVLRFHKTMATYAPERVRASLRPLRAINHLSQPAIRTAARVGLPALAALHRLRQAA